MPRLRSRCGSAGCRCATRSRSSSTAAATSARSRPTSPTASAAPAARWGRTSCCACPATWISPPPSDRDEAEELYRRAGRRAARRTRGADTVLAIWREPFEDLAGTRVAVDRRLELDVRLPAHRLLPTALVAPEKQIVVTAVCSARPLAEGRPPMGIVCAQQDVARVYPLPDDPERCLEDFLEQAAEHARRAGEQLVQPGGLGRSASSSSRATTSTRPASFVRGLCAASRSSPPSPSARSSSSASRSCSPAR